MALASVTSEPTNLRRPTMSAALSTADVGESGQLQSMRVLIHGEGNSIQVGRRNLILHSDVPLEFVAPDDSDSSDDEADAVSATLVASERGSGTSSSFVVPVPGMENSRESTQDGSARRNVPSDSGSAHDQHAAGQQSGGSREGATTPVTSSFPSLEIAGTDHSVQVGKVVVEVPSGCDSPSLQQVPVGDAGGEMPRMHVKIEGSGHSIQAGERCIRVTAPRSSEPGEAARSGTGAGSRLGSDSGPAPTTEALEEEGEGSMSGSVLDNVDLRFASEFRRLETDDSDQTEEKTADAPEPSYPQQETTPESSGKYSIGAKGSPLHSVEAACQASAIEGLTPEKEEKTLSNQPTAIEDEFLPKKEQKRSGDARRVSQDDSSSPSMDGPVEEAETPSSKISAEPSTVPDEIQPGDEASHTMEGSTTEEDDEMSNDFHDATSEAEGQLQKPDDANLRDVAGGSTPLTRSRHGDEATDAVGEWMAQDGEEISNEFLDAATDAGSFPQKPDDPSSGVIVESSTSLGKSQVKDAASDTVDEWASHYDDEISNEFYDTVADTENFPKTPDIPNRRVIVESSTSLSRSQLDVETSRPAEGSPSEGNEDISNDFLDVATGNKSSHPRTDVPIEGGVTQTSVSMEESSRSRRIALEPGNAGTQNDATRTKDRSRDVAPLGPVLSSKSGDTDRGRSSVKNTSDRLEEPGLRKGGVVSSQGSTAAADFYLGFTDNEISNEAIVETKVETPSQKNGEDSGDGKDKREGVGSSSSTAPDPSFFTGSQQVEIEEKTIADMADDDHWGPHSDEENSMDHDCYAEDHGRGGISEGTDPMPASLLVPHSLEGGSGSFEILKSQGTEASTSLGTALDARVLERVTRMEETLAEVKQGMTGQHDAMESRLDRMEETMEKILEALTAMNSTLVQQSSGSVPSSPLVEVPSGASGAQPRFEKDAMSDSGGSLSHTDKADSSLMEKSGPHSMPTMRSQGSQATAPTTVLIIKDSGQRQENPSSSKFLTPLPSPPKPARALQSFKGDGIVRPKQRPLAPKEPRDPEAGLSGAHRGRDEEEVVHRGAERGGRGTEGYAKRVEEGARHAEGYMKGSEGGKRYVRGSEGGLRGTEGYAKLDEGGTRRTESYIKGTDGGARGTERYAKGDDGGHGARHQEKRDSSHLVDLDSHPLEDDDGAVVPWRKPPTFGTTTTMLLERLMVAKRENITSDPEIIRLATALDIAIHPTVKPMPPRATGLCTVLCLDNSASMAGRPLEQMLEFVNAFLDCIEDIAEQHSREENIAIVTVGGGARVIHHLTNDYNSLRSALDGVKAEGRSPFFEAILVCFGLLYVGNTMMTVNGVLPVKPRVIFVTDGKMTDESQPAGPDAATTNPGARSDLNRLLYSMQRAPVYPRPIVWVPVDSADKTFLDSMSNTAGNIVAETSEVEYLAHYYRLQISTGLVLQCILQLPEAPVNLKESILSHIEVFSPDLQHEFKNIVYASVLKHLTRHLSTVASRVAGQKGQGCDHYPPCREQTRPTMARDGMPTAFPIKGRSKAPR